MHKPWHSLLFALALFAIPLLLGWILPGALNFTLRFPQPGELLHEGLGNKDLSEILGTIEIGDSVSVVSDTAHVMPPVKREKPALITDIQYDNPRSMWAFYDALVKLRGSAESVRVIHYGDSQIEGDRITGFLRQKLQAQFGGEGTGFASIMPWANNVMFSVTNEDEWDIFTVANGRDARVKHKNFGPWIEFCRITSYRRNDTSVMHGGFTIRPSKNSAAKNLRYNKIRLYYGGAKTKSRCDYYEGSDLVLSDTLDAWGNFRMKEFPVTDPLETHHFKFITHDSPDFYGISLEGAPGLLIDNVAMRGSSGTFFHNVDDGQLKLFYSHLNLKMIILQYGGNSLPAITD